MKEKRNKITKNRYSSYNIEEYLFLVTEKRKKMEWWRKIKSKLFRGEKEISYPEAIQIQRQRQQKDYVWIDVRSKMEYEEGHLPGAISFPLQEINQISLPNWINKDTIIFCYCQSGNRSRKASKLLQEEGYANVYNIRGGLNAIEIRTAP